MTPEAPDCLQELPLAVGGAEACPPPESTHDSFCADKHANWLINSAGLGLYAHGRVHQEGDFAIFVGDMVHKRGYLATDDVLKMEEQALESMGDPLCTNSKMGALKALVLLPNMNTANGEGDVIGYYEGGVVAFDTFKFPRESRYAGDGELVQKGWHFERLVNHMLNTVSAVGRYAVAVMPRDHFFRSIYGLHFLKSVLGEGTFNPENINSIGQDVQPLLDGDPVETLEGAANGYWLRGGRLFATVGLHESGCHSATALGKGFVSINQATTFTEDRTPRHAVEGAWVLDHDMQGVHQFLEIGLRPEKGSFGFLASDRDTDLYFATVDRDAEEDERDGDWLPIEWSFETGQFEFGSPAQMKKLTEGVLEGTFSPQSSKVRVMVRTDLVNEWHLWEEFEPCDKRANFGEKFVRVQPLGQPPRSCREASWFQFRVEGLGYAEIRAFRAEVGEAGSKTGQPKCVAVSSCEEDPFKINNEPCSERWQETNT